MLSAKGRLGSLRLAPITPWKLARPLPRVGLLSLKPTSVLPGENAVRVVLDCLRPQPLGGVGKSRDLIVGFVSGHSITERDINSGIPKPGDRGVNLAVVQVGQDF